MGKEIVPKKERETIRQELNIEKWSLFAPSTHRKKSRVLTREIILKNGDKITRKVIIGMVNENEVDILRIADYKVYSVLVKLWEKAEKPVAEKVYFTLYSASNLLETTGGGRNYRELNKALERLRGVPIKWEDSFYCKKTGITEKLVKHFNILEDLEVFERKKERIDQPYFAFSSFKLNYRIINNLLNNHSKPLYLDVILKFKKEISVLLYRQIDLIMADKNLYERKTKELFRDLDLGEYDYASKRKQLLEPVLKELEGVELTTGVLDYAKMERTADGKDWKVVFRKAKKRAKIEQGKALEKTNSSNETVLDIFNQKFPDKRGTLTADTVEKLLANHSTEKIMLHIIRIGNDDNVNNPAGLLRISLEKDWSLAPTKEEMGEREKQEREEMGRRKREQEQKEKERYLQEKEEEERLDKMFFGLSLEEQESWKEEARRKIVEEHLDDGQEMVNQFFLRDVMVMIKVREMLRSSEGIAEAETALVGG